MEAIKKIAELLETKPLVAVMITLIGVLRP